MSARLRLTLSYAGFLVTAGAAVLAGVYLVLRYVPDYPLTAANPRASGGEAVASRQEILDTVVTISVAIMAALAVIGLGGGWLLAGWILRPLRAINDAARVAATGRLDHRIRLAGRSDEFGQLANSFDHMLERLHDAFMTQERFAANASHELRTPLAVTATLLDVARTAPASQDYPQLLERLQLTNARAIGLTEALLRMADANAVTAVAEPLDLAAVVRGVLGEQAGEAAVRGVILEAAQLDPATTVGDATLLTQLAANLIQNAIRHNSEPGDGAPGDSAPRGAAPRDSAPHNTAPCRAWIATSHDPRARTVTLRVENTGATYSAAATAQLAEPFLRGEGRTTRGDGDGDGDGEARGYGLGLALVSRIAAVHDGTLTVVPRAGGGLVVHVTLPDRGA